MNQRTRFGLLAILGCTPSPVFAHLVSTGLGPVYDGIGHFFLSLEDLLPLLALLTLSGLQGPTGGRRAVFWLPPVWLLGAFAGAFLLPALQLPSWLSGALALSVGILLATDPRLSLPSLTGILLLVGGMLGFTTGIALASQSGAFLMLLGGGVALSVLCTLMASAAVKAGAGVPWLRIATRVGGSWVAGVGLLMLGWQLR